MVTLHETEVDGVPTFWVETGRPTLAAQLIFRQGQADEPLHESGWLHLLEHLALHDRGGGTLAINGSVSQLLTTFDAHGPVDAVADHFARVTGWLSEPELRGLDRERGVLRAEGSMRGGPFVRALGWRYGACGPGVSQFSELGLSRVTAEALGERARRVFNRGNAVLVLDGPPSASLRLTLPDGGFLAPQPVVCLEEPPAVYADEGGLILTGTVPRGHPATFVPAFVERRLREQLRDLSGGAYAPWSSYEAVDEDTAVVAAGSDLNPELLRTVVDTALTISLELGQGGVRRSWLDEAIEVRLQSLLDPYAAVGVAVHAAHAALNGRAPKTHDQLVDELRDTDLEQVNAGLAEFHSTLLLGAPGQAAYRDKRPVLSFPEGPRRASRHRRHRNWPADRSRMASDGRHVELAVGRTARTMATEDVVGVMAWSDGSRHVIDRRGWGLTIDPASWHGGQRLVAAIDRAVPEHLHLPQASDSRPAFQPMPWLDRWRLVVLPALAYLVLVFCLLLGIASIATGHIPSGVFIVFIGTGLFVKRPRRSATPRT